MMPDQAGQAAPMADTALRTEAHKRQQKGTRQLLVARASFFACSYVGSAILTRNLGAISYGVYGVIISLVLWLEMVANAGVPSATAKLIADGRHGGGAVERAARSLLVVVSLLLLAVCWLLAPAVARLMGIPNGTALLRLAILDLPLAGIYASYEGVLNGHRRFGAIAAMHLIFGMAKLAGIVALVGLGFSIERVLIANVLASVFICGALLARYPPGGFRPNRAIVSELVAIAAPMAVYLISGQVLVNLDLWSLKVLWKGSGEVVGQYVASMNLARTLMLVPAVQAGVLFASVAWAVASRDGTRALPHVREASRFAIIIAAAACVILGFNGSAVLSLLFSAAYAEGDRFLRLQLAGFGLFALVDAFANALQAGGRQWRVAGALISMIPVVWLSNYLLIPRLGPIGAAMSMLFGMTVSAVATGAMVSRQFGSPISSTMVFRVVVAAVVTGVVSAAIPAQGPAVLGKLVLLAGIYVLVLHAQGEITREDLGLR